MVRVSLQRAAMAILLVGMMIAPLGICLHQSPKGAHSCCMQTESSHSLRADCCIVRTQLLATLVAPTMPAAGTSLIGDDFAVFVRPMAVGEHPALAVLPPLSPQHGAFALRI
jgi:hypothetical protein